MRRVPAQRGVSDSGAPCHYLRCGSDRARACPALVSAAQRPNGRTPSQTLPVARLLEAAQRGTCNPRTPALAALKAAAGYRLPLQFSGRGRPLRVTGAPLPSPTTQTAIEARPRHPVNDTAEARRMGGGVLLRIDFLGESHLQPLEESAKICYSAITAFGRRASGQRARMKRFPECALLPNAVRGSLANLFARRGKAKNSLRDIFPAVLNFVFFSVLGDIVVSLIKWLIYLPF